MNWTLPAVNTMEWAVYVPLARPCPQAGMTPTASLERLMVILIFSALIS
jgi:hypothetical protein